MRGGGGPGSGVTAGGAGARGILTGHVTRARDGVARLTRVWFIGRNARRADLLVLLQTLDLPRTETSVTGLGALGSRELTKGKNRQI